MLNIKPDNLRNWTRGAMDTGQFIDLDLPSEENIV